MTRNAPNPNSCRNAMRPAPGTASMAIPASIRSTPKTTISPRTIVLTRLLRRRLRGRVRLDNHGGPVGDDLGHRRGHLGAVEAHRDHRVGAHEGCVLDQSVERLAAGVLEQLGVLMDLAAGERAQPGHDVAGEAPRPDDEPEGLALRLHGPMAGDER